MALVGELLGHKQTRTTQRYAHLANHVVRQGLEIATERIVEAVTPVAALPPAPFKPMRDAQWKAIAAIVESTRGRCGGARTDLRRTVDAIRWILRTEAKWRELPAEYVAPTTCWRWYERWCGDGTWQQIAAALELPETEVGREPGHRPPRPSRAEPPRSTLRRSRPLVSADRIRPATHQSMGGGFGGLVTAPVGKLRRTAGGLGKVNGRTHMAAKARFLTETEALRMRVAHTWLTQRLAEQPNARNRQTE